MTKCNYLKLRFLLEFHYVFSGTQAVISRDQFQTNVILKLVGTELEQELIINVWKVGVD